jgi:exonuclease SbcC
VVARLGQGGQRTHAACQRLGEVPNPFCEADDLRSFVSELQGRLDAFEPVQSRVQDLRASLGAELGEPGYEGVISAGQQSLPQQRTGADRRLRAARRWHRLARFNVLAVLLLSAALWAGWYLLVAEPTAPEGVRLSALLHEYVGWWHDRYRVWLYPAAAGLSALALLLLLRSGVMKRRVRRLRAECDEVSRRMEVTRHRAELIDHVEGMAWPKALESLAELGDEALTRAVDGFSEGPGRVFLEEESLTELQGRADALMESCDLHLRQAREAIAGALGGLAKESEQYTRVRAENDAAMAREEERRRQAEAINARIEAVRSRVPAHESRIRLLELARDLVRGTCRELYARFNRVLRRYTGEVMPRLTEGRYQHLQIDEDLTVRVFSTDKSDFAGVEELSSGTQRQVMLAVRLAMAKALTEAAVHGDQFVILDEPFAFFDRERTRRTLEALPGIDPLLGQLWIISQDFEGEPQFRLHLRCVREADELVA